MEVQAVVGLIHRGGVIRFASFGLVFESGTRQLVSLWFVMAMKAWI